MAMTPSAADGPAPGRDLPLDLELPLERLRDEGVIDLHPRMRALIPVPPGDEGEDDGDG
jgi:hypothetical protein